MDALVVVIGCTLFAVGGLFLRGPRRLRRNWDMRMTQWGLVRRAPASVALPAIGCCVAVGAVVIIVGGFLGWV